MSARRPCRAIMRSRRAVGGIIFDGVHVEHVLGDSVTGPPAELIDAWMRQVRAEGGYDLKIVVKPFANGCDVASSLPTNADAEEVEVADTAEWLNGDRMLPYPIAKVLRERN